MNIENLFKDDFEGRVWSVISGKWDITVDNTRVYRTYSGDSLSRSVTGDSDWRNYIIDTKVKVNGWGSLQYQTAGILARYNDPDNYYIFAFESTGKSKGQSSGELRIKRKYKGSLTVLSSKSFTLEWGKYYNFEAVASGRKFIFSVNGVEELSAVDKTLTYGRAGLISCFGDIYFDDFVVKQTVGIIKPGPDNTGPVNEDILVPSSTIYVTKDNSIIENVDVTGSIIVKANNVTIRNFKVTSPKDYYPVRVYEGYRNTLIEDGEIDGAEFAAAGVLGYYYTAKRLNVYNAAGDGFKGIVSTTIQECWAHHLGKKEGAHADGVQISRGSHFNILGNNFDMPINEPGTLSNAAVLIGPSLGDIDDVLVYRNWLNGGNYTVYSVDKIEDGVIINTTTNSRIINNRFGRDYRYGIKNINADTVWSENIWEDNGEPAP